MASYPSASLSPEFLFFAQPVVLPLSSPSPATFSPSHTHKTSDLLLLSPHNPSAFPFCSLNSSPLLLQIWLLQICRHPSPEKPITSSSFLAKSTFLPHPTQASASTTHHHSHLLLPRHTTNSQRLSFLLHLTAPSQRHRGNCLTAAARGRISCVCSRAVRRSKLLTEVRSGGQKPAKHLGSFNSPIGLGLGKECRLGSGLYPARPGRSMALLQDVEGL